MRILVFGAGVLGSLYAAKLRQVGHEVAILARGGRLAELRSQGIVLEEATNGMRTVTPIEVVEHLGPEDAYELILVVVRKDQLAGVLPLVGANHATPTVLFMVNTMEGPEELIRAVGRKRVLQGFPGAGGSRDGAKIRYHVLSARQQPTTLGELDEQQTSRLARIAAALRESGFPVAISANMDAWLKTHVAWTCPAAHALYMVGGSNYALARTPDAVVLWVRAVREGYWALRSVGLSVTPLSLLVFEALPEPFMVAFLRRLLDTPMAELVLARHASAARAEYVQLGDEFIAFARRAGRAIPAFNSLRPYVDPRISPIAEGGAGISMRWIELAPWLGGLALLATMATRVFQWARTKRWRSRRTS